MASCESWPTSFGWDRTSNQSKSSRSERLQYLPDQLQILHAVYLETILQWYVDNSHSPAVVPPLLSGRKGLRVMRKRFLLRLCVVLGLALMPLLGGCKSIGGMGSYFSSLPFVGGAPYGQTEPEIVDGEQQSIE